MSRYQKLSDNESKQLGGGIEKAWKSEISHGLIPLYKVCFIELMEMSAHKKTHNSEKEKKDRDESEGKAGGD